VAKTKKIEIKIQSEQHNQRIDKILSLFSEIGSRSQAQILIEKGLVTLKGKPLKASYLAQAQDLIEVLIPLSQENSELTPFDIPLEIQYEDDDLLVVNKPAPLVVHPAHGHSDKTLVNALVYHTQNLSMGFAEKRPGIVHRLDKETSGLLVVAKNNFAQEFLAQQFKERTIHRKYLAMCYGHPKLKSHKIESLLARHPLNRKKFASTDSNGKIAITHYTVLKESPKGVSLLECKLETGRTHQIRVHLSELNHPVIGDTLYGSDSRFKNLKSSLDRDFISSMNRIALHAKELGFVHPKTHEKYFFEAELPDILLELGSKLGLL
jgi:23S rRNA pseudouridine1911/1915/1917 synthase